MDTTTHKPIDAVAKEKVEGEQSRAKLGQASSSRYAPGRAGASSRAIDEEDDDGGDRHYAEERIVDDDDYD